MGGALSNFFQSGHALLSSSHNRQVSEQTKRNIRIIFDALRANPKVRYWATRTLHEIRFMKSGSYSHPFRVFRWLCNGWTVFCRRSPGTKTFSRFTTRKATTYCKSVSGSTTWKCPDGVYPGTSTSTAEPALCRFTLRVSKGKKVGKNLGLKFA